MWSSHDGSSLFVNTLWAAVDIIVTHLLLMLLAYRAILAEPRTKASTTEEYSGGTARGDYMSSADSMNQYAFPMGTQLPYIVILVFLYTYLLRFQGFFLVHDKQLSQSDMSCHHLLLYCVSCQMTL